jgi:DNA-binding transcriptional LysR family regulator
MNRSVDIRQLRYFVAVAEEANFRRAAERLHITQPPLSRQVSELEHALGIPLLSRNTRRVQLTPAGEIAHREFAKLVAAFDATLERVAGQAAALPQLHLGVLYWFDLKGLPAFERALQASGLVSAVTVSTLNSHEAIKAVRRGALDAAVVAHPIETHGLNATVIGTVRLAAFVPASSPLARRRLLSLHDLNQQPPFFRFRRSVNPLLYEHFARQYESYGFRPSREAPAPEAMGVFAQIGAGRGCTCMPEAMATDRYRGVVARRLREAVFLELALVTPPRLEARLRDTLLKAARHLGPPKARRAAPRAV